jgi:signal transduction histidine kinase/CheY-like chemotaxis protein
MNILSHIDKDITLLLDNLPVGIIRFNSDRRCIYANRWILDALDIVRTDSTRFGEIYDAHLSKIHPEDLPSELDATKAFLFEKEENESTYRLYDARYGDYRWVTNKKTIVSDDVDHDTYMYTLQDVHNNKVMEIKLREQTLRAEEAYNHKSVFLANMSHEIRTPLNGIVGMLTLLEDTTLNNEQQDYIEMVKECSFNLMTIINDILDYSKLEVGKITLDLRPINIQECIETTNDIVLSKVHEKSLEYSYNIHSDVPAAIYTDANRLKQILLNLLSNAIKFTDEGTILLNIESIARDEFLKICDASAETDTHTDGDAVYLRFDITDTGCGIQPSEKEKLFKSFSQVDHRITNKVYQGTGLGLAISKELIELMNGTIWLESSEWGRGSTFSFVIETRGAEEEPVEYDPAAEGILRDSAVLIVDDNLYNRISLMGIVTKWGMKPYAFSNSEEALYYARLTRFDIGLIDICMPKIDGLQFAAKLREMREFNNRTFPLVALSSLGERKVGVSKYFRTHLVKPVKEHKLKAVCIDLLQKHTRSIVRDTHIQSNAQTRTTPTPQLNDLENYIIQNNLGELKQNIRILLAEDIFINRKVICGFLNKLGYTQIDVVENGQACLDAVFKTQYDIILLDIRMPIMNGEEVMEHIKAHFAQNTTQRRPYIVAVTAYCLREDKEKYLLMGFDNYIPKPVTTKELTQCMNGFIAGLLAE